MTVRKLTYCFNMLKIARFNGRQSSTTAIFEADSPKATINEEEVSKLSKLSSVWWDVNGQMGPLHSMNKLRVQFIRDLLLYSNTGTLEAGNACLPLKDLNIMDVGCGGGILCEPLARIGANVTGLDASKELINIAKDHASKDPEIFGKIEYINGSIEELAKERAECYDAVVASEVLEHVSEKELFLEACVNTLKPGGSIIITTLNKTMFAWVSGVIAAEYILHLVPQATHDWEKFIGPDKVQYMLEKHGCYTKLVHGMFYNFICNEWLWTPNTAVNYALHAVKKK